MANNKSLWISTVLFALVFLALSAPNRFNNTFLRVENARDNANGQERNRILLLTAHPDDECMFFAPTLLGLTRVIRLQVGSSGKLNGNHRELEACTDVYSLCLSSGDAEGLGETRKRELEGSLDVLGVPPGRRWVLDEPFHDNITLSWDVELIAHHVKHFIDNNKIDIVLTFDDRGISSHPNHISLEHGVRTLLSDSSRKGLRAFSLKTTALLPKYTGVGAALFAKLEHGFCIAIPLTPFLSSFTLRPLPPSLEVLRIADCSKYEEGGNRRALFVSGWSEYAMALRAMRSHRSQLVWFRWLYVMFSRYMWVNEWEEIVVESN